jgi:antitoxin (DNA-binding transcriptional repressor) of toxin-antitoxin stability system
MGTPITATEAHRRFAEILGRVRFRGERFVILKNGHPVAELRPPEKPALLRAEDLPQIMREIPRLTPEEAEAFARDIETLRALLLPPPEPQWES